MAGRTLFVAGAGTEIGKTYVTASLTRCLRDRGRQVQALKPVASGVPDAGDPAFCESDTALLLAAQGLAATVEAIEACSPWRFHAPLAPDRAAALEGRTLALADLVAWCRRRMAVSRDASLIEGVGGLMSPITQDATGIDWLRALDIPVLLVAGSYLGAISHALTACETLRRQDLGLLAVVVSESADAPEPPEIVAASIARHAGAPVFLVRRGGPCPEELATLI